MEYVKISQGKTPKDPFSYFKYHKNLMVFSCALANRGTCDMDPCIPHRKTATLVYGQWAILLRYPEENRLLACLLKQAQQKNLKKRETSNKRGADRAPKTPTVSTRFLDGAPRGTMLLHLTKITKQGLHPIPRSAMVTFYHHAWEDGASPYPRRST